MQKNQVAMMKMRTIITITIHDQQKQTNSKDNDVNLWKQREERPINSSIHRQNVATLNADEAAKAQEEMRKAELAKLQKEEIESFKNS